MSVFITFTSIKIERDLSIEERDLKKFEVSISNNNKPGQKAWLLTTLN